MPPMVTTKLYVEKTVIYIAYMNTIYMYMLRCGQLANTIDVLCMWYIH